MLDDPSPAQLVVWFDWSPTQPSLFAKTIEESRSSCTLAWQLYEPEVRSNWHAYDLNRDLHRNMNDIGHGVGTGTDVDKVAGRCCKYAQPIRERQSVKCTMPLRQSWHSLE